MYYEITDRVKRVKDDGTEKEVNERYITDCLTFAEAEQKGMEMYAASNTDGDVVAVKRSNVKEIVNENEEKQHYFKATIVDIFTDDNGNEKALAWWKEQRGAGYCLIPTSGSDYHQTEDIGGGGIRLIRPVYDAAGLADVLRSGEYELREG